MAWYHWLASYLLIIAAFTFWIVPEKSLALIGGLILLGIIAYLMMRYLPPKEDENKPISLPKWLKTTKNIFAKIVVVLAGAVWISAIALYVYTLF